MRTLRLSKTTVSRFGLSVFIGLALVAFGAWLVVWSFSPSGYNDINRRAPRIAQNLAATCDVAAKMGIEMVDESSLENTIKNVVVGAKNGEPNAPFTSASFDFSETELKQAADYLHIENGKLIYTKPSLP